MTAKKKAAATTHEEAKAPAGGQENPEAAKAAPKKPAARRSAPKKAPPKKAGNSKGTRSPKEGTGPTLGEVADGYLKHMQELGKSRTTVFSYSVDLGMALTHFGEYTEVQTISTKAVQAYFNSAVVTQTRKGRAKAQPTIDKARRVLRLALVWAEAQGLIGAAPIPEGHAPRRGKKADDPPAPKAGKRKAAGGGGSTP